MDRDEEKEAVTEATKLLVKLGIVISEAEEIGQTGLALSCCKQEHDAVSVIAAAPPFATEGKASNISDTVHLLHSDVKEVANDYVLEHNDGEDNPFKHSEAN